MPRAAPCALLLVSMLMAFASSTACDLDWTVRLPDAPDAVGPVTGAVELDADPNSEAGEAGTDARTPRDAGVVDDAGEDADASDDASDAPDANVPCSVASPCAAGTYCVYADHYCGSGLAQGVCRPRATSCAGAALEPVCGCDGEVYTSTCAASAAGRDLSRQACSSSPPGSHACGYRFCDADEPCRIEGTGSARTYSCGAPNSCALCLCSLGCLGGSCGTEGGHIVVRCP